VQFLETHWREGDVSEPGKRKIGVIGGGLMGHGIAYLFAAAGHPVGLFEPMADIGASLPKRLQAIVELFGDDPALLQRIDTHEQLAPAVKGAAFVFEAAPEKLLLKQKIFAELEGAVAPETILASNSSISNIASASSARISGIRRIWSLWSRSSRTTRPATQSCARRWTCCVMPEKFRSTSGAISRASSAIACSTP
jgi:hypothetical protein